MLIKEKNRHFSLIKKENLKIIDNFTV